MLYDLFLVLLAMITGQLIAELKVLSDMIDPFENDSDRAFDSRWIEPAQNSHNGGSNVKGKAPEKGKP